MPFAAKNFDLKCRPINFIKMRVAESLPSFDIEKSFTNPKVLFIYKNKRPTGQLRQSDNTYNMAFFPPNGNKNKESFEKPKKPLFLSHLCSLFRAPIKKSST